MSDQPKRETPDEWAARMIREHGPVPLRIGQRLAHLMKVQGIKPRREEGAP